MTNIEQIRQEVEIIFWDTEWCHDLEHTLRVRNIALHIGKIENANLEILEIAALLHDIGREHQQKSLGKICHAEKWAELAKEILDRYDFSQEIKDWVIHCIATHRKKWTKIPESLEAKILFDADKIDSIWATWIGRTFQFAWEIHSRFHNKDIDLSKTEEYSSDDTAYREYMLNLRFIKNKIHTEEWKKLAEWRHNFMIEFFERLNNEVDWII